MTMSDKKILKAKDGGDIVIFPYSRENLATSSYDVRIGEFFYREQRPELENDIFNILDPSQVEKVWGKPQRAERVSDLRLNDLANINPDDRIIMLDPGETILGHTEEFIGGKNAITTMMKARSSLGRNFILVCKCAGWGDVGYTNRWTMEITNVSRYYRIPLVVGMRVAQIIFTETGEILDRDYTSKGAYQNTTDIDYLVKNWKPEMMLPKIRR